MFLPRPRGVILRRASALSIGSVAALFIFCGPLAAHEDTADRMVDGVPAGAPSPGLDEIIVTASKVGATDVQRTPMAISAWSSEDLSRSLSVNIQDVTSYSPGLSIAEAKGGNAMIYIRGIGSSNYNSGADPDVTVQVDGVYLARQSEVLGDFLDVERVEVLRGPQGTLYGRNAVGGTINIISRPPTDVVTQQLQLSAGNYGLLQQQAYVSGPLIADTVLGSLSASFLRHDHYVRNIAPGGNDLFNAGRGAMRAQLRVELSEGVVATTRFDWARRSEDDDGYDTLLAPYPGAVLSDRLIRNYSTVAINTPQHSLDTNYGISEDIDMTFGDHAGLKSISAFRKDVKRFVIDSDDTNINFLDGFADERETEITQEFNLPVHYSRFDGVIGLYYFDEADRMHSGQITNTTASGAPTPQIFFQVAPDNPTSAISGFAQATYHITPAFGLTAGYRYSYEDKTGIQHSVRYLVGPPRINVAGYPFDADVDRRFHGVTPKLGVDWQANRDVMVYASATRGYKSGGYNYAAISDRTLTYDPETVWSYEAGARTDWLDRRLRVNLTGFIYDYRDLQLQTILGPGVITIVNAATATGKGLEAEISAKPAADWQLTLNVTLLDSRYSSFPNAAVASGVLPFVEALPEYNAAARSFDARGRQLSFAPKATASFTGQRDLALANGDLLYARADFFVTSRVYYDPSNVVQMSQSPYGLINLFLGYHTGNGHWRTQLFVKNLADKGYINGAQGNVVPTGLVGAPRTFGLRVTRNF